MQGQPVPVPWTPAVCNITIAPVEDRSHINPSGSAQVWTEPHVQSLSNITVKKNTPSFVLLPCLAPAPCGLSGTCSCACSWWLCRRWTSCLQVCSPITAKPPEALSVGAEGHMVRHTVPVRPPYVLAAGVAGVRDWRPSVVDGSVAATPSCQALLRGWEGMWKTTQTPNSLLSSARRIGNCFLNFMFCGDEISEVFGFKALSWSCLSPGVKGMCGILLVLPFTPQHSYI